MMNESTKRLPYIAREMLAIIEADDSTEDEKDAAASTVVEAIAPDILAQAVIVPDLLESLETALRQWASYYGEHNSKDIEDGTDSESACYRRCARALKPSEV
jgi:hypothetical protein